MGGTKIGTYKYMAPEVYNNNPYGHSADIYSLGLVLYWLLNERRMPFLPLPPAKLKAGMEEEARERRLRGEPLPAPAHGSKALQAIVLKACAFDPAERYHTAAEMLQDLEKLGAKPAMPELVTAAALGQQTAATPASEQKPAGFDPLISAAGAASEEETSTEYQPMAKAPESQPETSASVTKLEPATKLSPVGLRPLREKTPTGKMVSQKRDVKKTMITLILVVVMLALYFMNAGNFLGRMVVGNTLIGWRYEGLRPAAIALRNVLVKLLGATVDNNFIYDRFGVILSVGTRGNVFLTACYLMLPSLFVLALPMILGIFFGVRAYRKKRNLPTQLPPAGKWAVAGTGILMYALTAEAYLCRIISGNIMRASLNENARDRISAINAILVKLTGSHKNEHGIIINHWGTILNSVAGKTSMKNACYLIIPAAIMLIVPVVVGAWIGVRAILKHKTEKGIVFAGEETEQ